MKKIFISSFLILLTVAIFQTNELKSGNTITVTSTCNKKVKPFSSVQCATVTCHNAGASH